MRTWLGQRACVVSLLALLGFVMMPGEVGATKSRFAEVQGEVMVVNVQDTPNVIVLRGVTSKNVELIVGATVDSEVDITRGDQRVSLSELQVGELVDMVYVKTLEGLIARSINVR